jgi:4-hydroxy-tetrahydrodipicolinate synthase
METWAHLRAFELLRARHGDGNNVSVVKEALASLGLCSRAVRAPISELPEHERREVEAILASWATIRTAA